jgi:hypothetical protein
LELLTFFFQYDASWAEELVKLELFRGARHGYEPIGDERCYAFRVKRRELSFEVSVYLT